VTPFGLKHVAALPDAVAIGAAGATFIAGGTDLLQLLGEGVAEASELADITGLDLRGVAHEPDGVRIGALTRLAEVAPALRDRLTVVAEALAETASPQIRNMATVGGNLLQRTRCLYFRDPAVPCNKRLPGSGCPALDGQNRMNAIFGGSEHCIAVQPSDLATALVALDAELTLADPDGERRLRLEDFYRLPGDTPERDTELRPGELITAVHVPDAGLRSRYFKLRDRASFEWALVSLALAVGLDGEGRVADIRLCAGGVGIKPWRLRAAEEALRGRTLDADAAADTAARATDGAGAHGRDAFKIPMLRALVARALDEMRVPA
jgi:xanthine dehydrogenase YagS FAD-binding subunit